MSARQDGSLGRLVTVAALLCLGSPLPGLLAGAEEGRAVGAAPGWELYRSEAGRFQVDLPGPPRISRTVQRTFAGSIDSVEYLVELGALELRVEHHDVPVVASLFVSERGLLERAQHDLVDGEGAQALGAGEELHRDGQLVREVRYRLAPDDGRDGRARFLLVERRLYVLAALHPPDRRGDPALERFFDSFAVVRD